MGCASLGLECRLLGTAADSPADVDRGGLSPPVVQRLHPERQPGHAALRLHGLQRHGAPRSAAARRRRLHHLRPLRRGAAFVRANRQSRDRLAQLRRVVSVLQRGGCDVERADAGRPDVPGRHQHRSERGRQLRGQGEPARAQHEHRRRPRDLDRQPHESGTVTSPTAS